MLPTHIVRIHDSAGADRVSSEQGMAYPPVRPSSVNASANGGRRSKSSLQNRICGPRGVTSLTIQAQTPYKVHETAKEGTSNGDSTMTSKALPGARPSRWNSLEFYVYAFVFAVALPYMCWVPIHLSRDSSINFPRYSWHLKRGWLFGRLRDDSDFQYRSFRDYLPMLSLVILLYVVLSKSAEKVGNYNRYQSPEGSLRRPNRIVFLTLFTATFVLALHGTNTLKLLIACTLNFATVKLISASSFASITPLAVWTLNIALLFLVHWNQGFSYIQMGPSLAWLDSYTGFLPRWQINYNITMLRLVSFSMDFYWARGKMTEETVGNSQISKDHLDPRKRQETALPLSQYSYHIYLLYAMYPPLFIAGPIMGFNDFARQLHSPVTISGRYILQYAVRLVATILTMEFILHFMYVNAIKDSKAWRGTSPMELSMIGFWNLIIVWLKLLIPWRFFRFWALADGVDAPENMIRCMANNYSTLGFWRSWHRSYNLWIVRYIYIPLGGAKNAIAATVLVFTFVALWHDLSLKLLYWGWIVSIFIVPEMFARKLFPSERYGSEWWYRHVCAVGGVLNVLMMMTGNLVGFAIGVDGITYMWQQLLSSWDGLRFMILACAVLFVGVQVMFEYREEERRRGVARKC